MIVIFALAIGTLGPAPAAPGVVDIDCVRTESVVSPPKRRKPGVVRRAPRLFKADPKPIVEPCEEAEPRLPPSAALPPLEPEVPFTPMPEVPDVPLFAPPAYEYPPLYVVPPTEPPAFCDCGPSPGYWAPPIYGVPPIYVLQPPNVPAIPEPHEWMLLAAGLYLLHRKARHGC